MKIASVKAMAADVGFQTQALQTGRVASPMSRWPEYADRRASWMWPSKKTFVRIESEDGAIGWSCTNGGEITALIISAHLSKLVENRSVDDLSELWEQMTLSLLPIDRSGFAMMAVAAIDIALWDLRGRIEGRSLLDLLGGARHESLAVYATTSRPEDLAGEDWWGLKAAMPYGPEAGDAGFAGNVELIKGFRDAAGPRRKVTLDAFMAWDAEYTLRFAEAAADSRLHWIEDPLPPNDLDGYRTIRQSAGDSIRLALGNFCYSRSDCHELLREGLVDVLQPDVAWAGGITECLRILDMASAAGVEVILHNTSEQPWALALAAARQLLPVVEFVDRGPESALYTLMGERPDIRGGELRTSSLTVPNRPPETIKRAFEDFR
ncbi:MAG TPA: enolase C-terminal domain-like protein [Devosiaceae bacterium]|jgi:L-rhamnonate dehydratase|nr:enolase C-terminal domain-like protein [Devosiaceae bacterium]